MRKYVLAVALGAVVAVPAFLRAQVADTKNAASASAIPWTFDVASIRPTSATDGHIHIWSSSADGDFRAQNVSITDLLEFAYALPESRFVAAGESKSLLHGPRFDLEAKSSASLNETLHGLPSEAAKEKKRALVRALLADRFLLATHMETREIPIYTLTVAKSGAKFTESKANGTSYSMGRGTLSIEGGDSTVAKMADNLANVLGRPVVDQTGIAGRYLMKLRWMPEDGPPPMLNGAPDTSLPSIFTAVEEQLGLKLVPGKGPVPVLVVDHVQLPSAN